jgi:hypothetical protein
MPQLLEQQTLILTFPGAWWCQETPFWAGSASAVLAGSIAALPTLLCFSTSRVLHLLGVSLGLALLWEQGAVDVGQHTTAGNSW